MNLDMRKIIGGQYVPRDDGMYWKTMCGWPSHGSRWVTHRKTLSRISHGGVEAFAKQRLQYPMCDSQAAYLRMKGLVRYHIRR